MLTRKNLFLFPVVLLVVVSCGGSRLDVDVSDVKVKIKYEDMRSKIQDVKGQKLTKLDADYKNRMPDIYNYFLGECLSFPQNYSDSILVDRVSTFQSDPGIKSFENEIDKKFKDLEDIKSKLNDGFRHLKYHFPNGKQPKYIVFMNTLFRSSVWCTENEIGIGMGNYLGEKSKTVSQLNPNVYYLWIKKAMKREFLERDVVENWVRTHYIEASEGNLIEQIIREGKVIYLTKAAFPEMEDHLIMRYTKKQWDWAQKNEFAFWKYLQDNQLLFRSDEITLMNLTMPGPKTSGIPIEGSPDRLGLYLGYQIVWDYMESSETSLKDLINVSYTEIMQSYEPEE